MIAPCGPHDVGRQATLVFATSSMQILLKFLLKRNFVVIPKSVTEARIRANIQLFDFDLDDADMAALSKLDRNTRLLSLDR